MHIVQYRISIFDDLYLDMHTFVMAPPNVQKTHHCSSCHCYSSPRLFSTVIVPNQLPQIPAVAVCLPYRERESQRSKQPDILRQREQKEVSLSFWFFKSVYCSWFLFVNSDFMFNFFSSSLFPYARDFGVINLGTVCHYPVDTSDPDNDKVFCQFQMISYIDSCNKVLLSRCL